MKAWFGGHRVVTAMAPRVAAADASNGEPAAAQPAVGFKRFDRIGRATGREAAVVAQPGADEVAVETYGRNEQLADHWRLRSSRVSISSRTRVLSSRSEQGSMRVCSRNTRSRGGSS